MGINPAFEGLNNSYWIDLGDTMNSKRRSASILKVKLDPIMKVTSFPETSVAI